MRKAINFHGKDYRHKEHRISLPLARVQNEFGKGRKVISDLMGWVGSGLKAQNPTRNWAEMEAVARTLGATFSPFLRSYTALRASLRSFKHEARTGTAASNKSVGACVLECLHALLTTLV
ncbi:hypothetical protein PIB30_028811 [Stylosanthes scabra]|uniref:Uncharacterized protein n=1 Tax=Stylosanthes scabra TaxID=79078 RepID=A0ABU6TB96_9FABA|nr:hypothetical protein [Stylosanthes scabra]